MVGYASNDVTQVEAHYNLITDTGIAVSGTENAVVDATLNYFGSDDPDFATVVEGPVTYDPWFIDEAMTQLRTLTVYVDSTYDASTPGWGVTNFATIQTAVDAVGSYGTVIVNDGTYYENVDLARPVALISLNGRDAVTIEGADNTGLLGTIQISSADVSVGTTMSNGFTIVGYDHDAPGVEHAAIYLKGSASGGLSVIGNDIIADGEAGLTAEYGHPEDGIEIAYNEFSGQTYVGSTVGGTSSVQFTTPNVPRSMIYISGGVSGVYFHDNIVGGSVGGLIEGTSDYYYNTGATLDCNAATSLATGAVIENNLFAVGSWAALRARGPYSTIQNNTFVNTPEGMSGVYVSNADNDVYAGNVYEIDAGVAGGVLGILPGSQVVVDGSQADYGYTLTADDWIVLDWPGGSMMLAASTGDIVYNDATDDIATILATAPTHFYVPDDFAQLQDAVAAASDGDTIFVAAGSYASSSTITVDKELTIIGEGSGLVSLDLSGCGLSWGLHITADNVTVEGMTVLPPLGDPGNLGTSSGGGFPVHVSPAEPVTTNSIPVQNLVLRDIVIEDGNRAAFDLHGVDGALLENLTARNSAYGNGIQLTGCSNIDVVGCTTEGNAWGGVAFYVSQYMELACSDMTFDYAANTIGETVYIQNGYGL